MNERIKELSVQAEQDCCTNIAWEWEKKFAELIIRECIDLVQFNSKGAGEAIKEHFGVTDEQ